MKPPSSTIDVIQMRLADAVATSRERTPEEQRDLLAGLLATAYAARRRLTTTS
jgi:hypothetical protein